MLFIIASVIAIIISALEIAFYNKKRSVGYCITTIIRNIVCIDLISLEVFRLLFMKPLHLRGLIDTSEFSTKAFVVFTLTAIVIGFLLQVFIAFFNTRLTVEKDEPKHKIGAGIFKAFTVFVFFLGVAAREGTVWGRKAFGGVTGDQLIINLTSPTEGTEASVYVDAFEGPILKTFVLTVLFALVVFGSYKLYYAFKNGKKAVFNDLAKRITCFVLAAVCLVSGVQYGVQKFKLNMVFNAYVRHSTIIDDNYVDPKTANIKWPEKKRNLIHIYLESMENSYLSKDLGGFMPENLMPNLTELAKTGTVFSDTDNYFGGPQKGTGTQWSIASMVNQMTGLPMKAPGWINTYGADGKFLPGAYTLGEMLEKQGYEQTCMVGASGTFGGLRYLFDTHGNWKFFDYDYAKENGYIPKDYKKNWGFEDDKLYAFAKEEITRLYETGKPFNFTMEDADTHRPGGYVSKGKKKPFKFKYANAIWNSDKDVCEFIKWIQAQPFYENTTIVLIGDHISMETKFFKDAGFTKKYKRTQFNCIINPAPSVGKPDEKVTRNRMWANWDYFPTIVASIGGEIEGNRLGIGTNLFSGEKTIFEKVGVKKANKQLEMGSKMYNEQILQVEKLEDAAGDVELKTTKKAQLKK